MMRVINLMSRMSVVAALAGGFLATPAFGVIGFTGRNSFSGTPTNYNDVPYNGELVLYSLPTLALSPLHGGDANYSFDLAANHATGGSALATAFGYVGQIGAPTVGTGSVIFSPAVIAGDPSPPNNIEYSVSLPANNSMDIMYGVTGPPPAPGATGIGITALNDVAGVNVTVSDNDGLAAIPVRVSAGTAHNGFQGPNIAVFPLTHGPGEPAAPAPAVFTGFVDAAGVPLTTLADHVNNVIEVRKAVISDFDGNGIIDSGDIDGFNIVLFGNPGDYEATYPWLTQVAAYVTDIGGDPGDPNCMPDGFADSADIDGFNERIFNLGGPCATDPSPGASPSAVPEPSSVMLSVLGLLGVAAMARRKRS